MTNLYNHQANKRVSAASMAFLKDEAHRLNLLGKVNARWMILTLSLLWW